MNDLHPTCEPWAEPIGLAAAGCLSPGEEREVLRHVEACAACGNRFRQMAALCGTLAALQPSAEDAAATVVRKAMSAVASGESEPANARREMEGNRSALLSHSLYPWRSIMRSPILRAAAAAAVFLVIVTGVALWFHGGGAAVTFADVAEKFLDVKNCKYTITNMVGDEIAVTCDCMGFSGHSRMETKTKDGQIESVLITDWNPQRLKALYLMPDKKVANLTECRNFPDSESMIGRVRSLMLKAKDNK